MKKPRKITSPSGGTRYACPTCGLSYVWEQEAKVCCGHNNNIRPLTGTFEERGASDLWDVSTAAGALGSASAKATNPKDAAAFDKAPLHLVPASFKAYTALALAEGAMKYGSWNWRAAGVRASVYVSALQRHIDKWFNGEEFDPETGVPHLANAAACLAVLIDSKTQLNMTDDRPPRQHGLPGLVNTELPTAIAGLREKFADKNPKHWTINDGGKDEL